MSTSAHADVAPNILWDRLRPLDNDPALDSGTPLARACVPGETVVVRRNIGTDTREQLGLHKGQFVVCVANTGDGLLEVVDGPGARRQLARTDINATRGFPADWTARDRDYLVWAYDRDTIIFRESLRGTFEGNFFYLLLNADAAMLVDSGTGYADLKPYVLPLLGNRPLYVVSTHNHSDHFGGHRHFIGVPNARFIGNHPGEHYEPYPKDILADTIDFFKLTDWPGQTVEFNLGTRHLSIIPVPGHTNDSIVIYDHQDRLLFSSDTIYPGLLFIEDWPHSVESLGRLEQFAKINAVQWVLGGHIEMSAARPWNGKYEYFNFGSATHRGEHTLQLPATAITEVKKLMRATRDSGQGQPPLYDARVIEREFHDAPYAPISLKGISSYYRINNDRLVNELIERHREFDAARPPLSQPIKP